MEQRADSDLKKIRRYGESALLYEKFMITSVGFCIVLFLVFAIAIYDKGETGIEAIFGYLMIGSLFSFLVFLILSRRAFREAAVLVFEHIRLFHRERLTRKIMGCIQPASPLDELLKLLDRAEAERGTAREKEPSADEIDNEFASNWMDDGTATLLAELVLRQAETGDADWVKDIDVVRTYYGQLLRFNLPIIPLWSGRRKLLKQHLANPAYHAEISSARRKAVKWFALRVSVLMLITGTLVHTLNLCHVLPSRDRIALYLGLNKLEHSLGYRTHAVIWLARAAFEGDDNAQYRLATILSTGKDTERDCREAAYWLWQASKNFNERAMTALAEMHENGSGIQKDEGAAVFWRYKASETRAKKAKRYIERDAVLLNGKMFCPGDVDCRQIIDDYDDFHVYVKNSEKEYLFRLREAFVNVPHTGNLELMKSYLSSKLGKINAVDSDGNTILMKSAIAGNREIAQFLVKKGIDREIFNYEGLNALSLAVRERKPDLVKLLVESGADVNRAGRQGMTPLHWSILSGDPEIARFLLAHGADPKARTKTGLNALQMAKKLKRNDIETMLREAGATE